MTIDRELEHILGAQQYRKSVEERNDKDTEMLRKSIRRTFQIADRVCMFFAGASAVISVRFFDGSSVAGLVLSLLSFFALIHLANYCNRRGRKKFRGTRII